MNAHSLTGFGFLSVVPLEIRDLIYRHIFFDRYCYSAQPSPSIGLLGASRALRDEAVHKLYSQSKFRIEFKDKPGMEKQTAFYLHVGKFQSDFDKDPSLRWQELGPSQEVVKRLDHVEVSINMYHYSFELFPGEIRDVDDFYEDLFRKLASTDRARKTCRIIFRHGQFDCYPWDRYPFSQDLRKLSTFDTVTLELECEAIDFDDFDSVDRSPVKLPWDAEDNFRGSARHMRMIAGRERKMEKLRVYLEETLGSGCSYERRNFCCLAFRPQSTQA